MDTVEAPHHTGTMHTLDRTGDVRFMWDPNNADEVAAARTTYDEMTRPRSKGGKGYLAYRAEGKEGHQGTKLTAFDPAAERIILVHPPQGG